LCKISTPSNEILFLFPFRKTFLFDLLNKLARRNLNWLKTEGEKQVTNLSTLGEFGMQTKGDFGAN